MTDIIDEKLNMNEPTENAADEKKVIKTQVTSLAAEDAKNGTKTPLPSAEEMVSRASASLMQKRIQLHQVASQLSRKQFLRVLAAATDIPTEGLPVLLKSENEKVAYALLQRIQADKFIIIQKHITDEMKRLKNQEGESNV